MAQNETGGAERRVSFLCFHLPGQAISEFRIFEPQPYGKEWVSVDSPVGIWVGMVRKSSTRVGKSPWQPPEFFDTK